MNYQSADRPRNSQGRPQFLPPAERWILPALTVWPEPEGCWGALVVVREKHRQIGGLDFTELKYLLEVLRENPEMALERWFDLKPPGAGPGAKPQILATTGQSLEDLGL